MKNIFCVKILLFITSILCLSCSKSKCNSVTHKGYPILSMESANQVQSSKQTTIRFTAKLNKYYAKVVSVDYTIVSGTATYPKDFVESSGTIIIPANQTTAYLYIKINGDSLRQPNLQFTVQLNNPQNCTLAKSNAIGTIISENGSYLPTDTSGFVAATSYTGYTLNWDEEFNGNKIDSSVWNFESGNNNGWGNEELEYYTARSKNAFVSDGNLIIEARKENYQNFAYTSARITTQNKKEFTYGRVDIRAKLPVAKGMWPALWMLGSNVTTVNWPTCGETDIMELVGSSPKQVVGSFHWEKADTSEGTLNNKYSLTAEDFSRHFHVFSLIWSKDSMEILVDNIAYEKASRADLTDGIYPFDSPFFLIFNVAIGGDWPGSPDATTIFPQRMYVDYVRYYKAL